MSRKTAQEIIDLVVGYLEGSVALVARVSTRIYEGVEANKNLQLPHIVYNVITNTPWGFFENEEVIDLFQIDVYAKTKTAAREIHEILYGVLHNKVLAGYFVYCEVEHAAIKETHAHRIQSDWEIRTVD